MPGSFVGSGANTMERLHRPTDDSLAVSSPAERLYLQKCCPITKMKEEREMSTIAQNAALVLIDVQNVWDHPKWGRRNNPDAETNIVRLLHAWRETKRPLFYFQHLEQGPDTLFKAGTAAAEIKDVVRPLEGESIVQKSVHSALM